MRAWRFHEFGEIGNLRMEDVPQPIPGPRDVLLRVLFASLNPADRYMVAGQYPGAAPLPLIVGRDCCGVVEEAIPGGRFQIGDRVLLLSSDLGVARDGTLAEYVAAPEACLVPLPEGWGPEAGAAAPLVYLTAWQALVDRGGLLAGQTVLVTGATGGVGLALVQLAKAMDAQVLATSRTETRRAVLSEAGADIVLDSALPGLAQRVKQVLGNTRVDLAIDLLGGDYLEELVKATGYGGRIIVVGLLAGLESRITLGRLIHKCLSIQGMSVNAYDPDVAQRAWANVVDLMDQRHLRPFLDAVFRFEDVQKGFSRLATGPLGKVCIMMSGW